MKRSTITVLIGFIAILYMAGCQDAGVQALSKQAAMRVDMPEATSYSGNFGITLEFEQPPSSIFHPDMLTRTNSQLSPRDRWRREVIDRPGRSRSVNDIGRGAIDRSTRSRSVNDIVNNMFGRAKMGIFDARYFPNLQWISSNEEQEDAVAALQSLDYSEFLSQYEHNKYLVLYRTHAGAMVYDFVEWTPPQPELFLLEEYRLTSHLGDYGTGRIINTLSLLPGEKKTYQTENYSSITEKEAASSSIFDSMTTESAESFHDAVMSEESKRDKSSKSFQATASVSASAGWGWGKASAKAGTKYTTNSSREEFARNISSAVSNHASRASANRSVEVNSSSTRETVDEKRTLSTKEIANPNLSRTLNFIFYQMNQEYITFLHLVDVSVGLHDANGEVTIVPLHDLQSLLDRGVLESAHKEVWERIVGELRNIRDYQGEVHPEFVVAENVTVASTAKEKRVEPGPPSCWLAPRYVSTYREASGRTIHVPGIIVAVNTIVLRTDGVYVDALLGQNSALAEVDEQADAARLWQMRYGKEEE